MDGYVYVTSQGDTWDLISYNLYGSERYMKNLIEANWEYLDILVFPSGVELAIPDIPEEEDEDSPFWRAGGADEDETYSETEDPEEEDEE